MVKIKQIRASEILNGKGNPTVEATVILADGTSASASTPSGTSIGTFEAAYLKDSDPNRWGGFGVLNAVSNIQNIIAPKLIGIDASKQQEIDKIMIELDGTQNKSRLGANSILAVSMAVAKAASKSSLLPLFIYLRDLIKKDETHLRIPTPILSLINGGKQAGGNLDFEGFLVIPASSKVFSDTLQIGYLLYNSLYKTLEAKNLPTLVGDEGGFGPTLASNEEALSLIVQSIQQTSAKFGFDIFLGVDACANNFLSEDKYKIKDSAMSLSSDELITYYQTLSKKFHLLYIEDPLYEEDWNGWIKLCSKMGDETIIVGDNITSTNPYRLQIALDKRAITGIVIKPSQIGTVMETLAVIEVARQAGLKITISSRNGETVDNFISDLAVAAVADYVNFGFPARGENVVKYNRLLEIENELKSLQTKTEKD